MENNDRGNIFVKIRFLYPSLTKSEKNIADLILDEQGNFTRYTMAECSKDAKCSDATVIRFCRRLGLEGFTELKHNLEDAVYHTYDNGRFRVTKGDSLKTVFEKIVWYYDRTLRDTLSLYSEEYERAYEALRKAKSIHFFGVGDAWVVCQAAQVKFLRLGIPCTAHSDLACMLSAASMLGPEDVAVGISFSGQTRAIVDSIHAAKDNGAVTIGIVHYEKQPLSKYTDINLYTATIDMTDAHDEIARRVAEHAIIETLYMKMVAEDRERFRERQQKSIATIIANKN